MWWSTKCALFVVGFFLLILLLSTRTHDRIKLALVGVIGLLYRAYVLWVVNAFIHELRYGSPIKAIDPEVGITAEMKKSSFRSIASSHSSNSVHSVKNVDEGTQTLT